MKFASIRLVTESVPVLARFYEQLLGVAPVGSDTYVELKTEGVVLAICSRATADFMHGGEWSAAANRSAILEFQVDDVDAEKARIEPLVSDWLQQPQDMPWGNRSMLFRDPDGTPVNVFKAPEANG